MLYHIGYTYRDKLVTRNYQTFFSFRDYNIVGNYFLTERGWDVWYNGKWWRA